MSDAKGIAFVTGASRGIGRGIALTMAEAGWDIVGTATKADPSNTEKGLFEVKPKVEALGRRFVPVAGDISSADDRARMVDEAIDACGAIDVLVNNAGVAPSVRADLLEMGEESYDRVMGINAKGPLFLSQRIAAQMEKQVKAGRKVVPSIIFVTSISARIASVNRTEYCMSKAALSMAATCFAARLAESGVCVFEVRPGIIQTDMTSGVTEKYDRLIAETDLVPQKRWGFPEDIGKACAALASGAFAFSTGTVLEVSGGMDVARL